MEGVADNADEQVLVLAATNLPQEIDPAAMRRFTYRIHVPLPDLRARFLILQKLLSGVRHNLSKQDLESIARCGGRGRGEEGEWGIAISPIPSSPPKGDAQLLQQRPQGPGARRRHVPAAVRPGG